MKRFPNASTAIPSGRLISAEVAKPPSPPDPAVPLPPSVQPSYQRLAYDPDDNVFALVWIGDGGYANGPSIGYADAQTWLVDTSGSTSDDSASSDGAVANGAVR